MSDINGSPGERELAHTPEVVAGAPLAAAGGGGYTPPPPPQDPEDEEEDGMLRMSFMDHLEELRMRIIRALQGLGVAFLLSLIFANQIWDFVRQPAASALQGLGIKDGKLVQIEPMEVFSTVWVKLPLVASLFLAAPWVVYQVWAFIAPGLYKKEKQLAVPFILSTAGLFLTGGAFAYWVAFRFGLRFLLGMELDSIQPMVSVSSYVDLFINVILGISLVFELPVVIFLLTLLRIASPSFLLDNSRYAILGIVILAAIITPTPDAFNLMLFAVPMIMLFFLGIFASYLLVLRREKRKFPWGAFLKWIGVAVILLGSVGWFAAIKLGYHFTPHWPFFIK